MGTFQNLRRESGQPSQTLIQPQLEIGQEDDAYEKEANHIADKVMKMPAGADNKVQMMSDGKEEKKMKDEDEGKVRMMVDSPMPVRKMSDGNGGALAAPKSVEQGISSSKGSGQTLPADTQQELGEKMNADFSGVKIHTDEKAVQMNQEVGAKAFAHGSDIYFNKGQYDPASSQGKHLLTHELVHTRQQGNGIHKKIQRKVIFKTKYYANKWYEFAGIQSEKFALQSEAAIKEIMRKVDSGEITTFNDIINATGKEYDFVGGEGEKGKKYRRDLIKDIIWNMHSVSDKLYYEATEFWDEIRKRAITSLDMRVTQGKTTSNMPAGYPNDKLPARVNEMAKPYWTVHPSTAKESYHFTLSATGKAHAYKALCNLLFIHQQDKELRTLMHCDYMVSAIHYKAMADTMGTAKFDSMVKNGELAIDLTPVSYWNITFKGNENESTANKSLRRMTISSENDIIIGDHLVFWNNEAYDDLNNNIGHSWRLENAIVSEGIGENRKFQGHGYFSPYKRDHFVDAMVGKFNELVTIALKYKNADNEKGAKAKFGYEVDGKMFYPVAKESGKWMIRYHEGGHYTNAWKTKPIKSRELKMVSKNDYPAPFVKPGETSIVAYRPIESIIQSR